MVWGVGSGGGLLPVRWARGEYMYSSNVAGLRGSMGVASTGIVEASAVHAISTSADIRNDREKSPKRVAIVAFSESEYRTTPAGTPARFRSPRRAMVPVRATPAPATWNQRLRAPGPGEVVQL